MNEEDNADQMPLPKKPTWEPTPSPHDPIENLQHALASYTGDKTAYLYEAARELVDGAKVKGAAMSSGMPDALVGVTLSHYNDLKAKLEKSEELVVCIRADLKGMQATALDMSNDRLNLTQKLAAVEARVGRFIAKLEVATSDRILLIEAMERMQAGFAGMFGDEGKTPAFEAWEICPEIIKQTLAKVSGEKES